MRPEGIDAFEVGTKNTLADGTLQANLTAWYYNYEGLQVSSIIDNTSVNQNIDAHLWGVEGEFFYAPDDNWQFDLNFGTNNSSIGSNVNLVDPRNPTGGRSDVVLIKDATLAASVRPRIACSISSPAQPWRPLTIRLLNAVLGAVNPISSIRRVARFRDLPVTGIALTNYGTCACRRTRAACRMRC